MTEEKEITPLLIVDNTDGDIKNGIRLGYYPDYLKQVEDGRLTVITPGEAKEYSLKTQPVGDGKDFYVGNPSAQNYVSMLGKDLMQTLIVDKSFAVKEALVWLGAKDITLKSEEKEVDVTNMTLGVKPQNILAGLVASLKVSNTNKKTIKITSYIESHDPSRRPKSPEKVRDFLFSHGLENDTSMMMLLERLKEDGELHGIEKYAITYLSEAENALNVAASINYSMFNVGLDFSRKHNHVRSIVKEVEINFG